MTKPKSYVPKERTPAQQAILDKARERAHAVLREKNKIVKSMKTEEEETQEKNEDLVEENQEEEKNSSPPSPEPEPVREPKPERFVHEFVSNTNVLYKPIQARF